MTATKLATNTGNRTTFAMKSMLGGDAAKAICSLGSEMGQRHLAHETPALRNQNTLGL